LHDKSLSQNHWLVNHDIFLNMMNFLKGGILAAVTLGSYYFLQPNPVFANAADATTGRDVSLEPDGRKDLPSPSIKTTPIKQQGRVLLEYWAGVNGSKVSDLTSTPNYPDKPSSREVSATMEIPCNLDTYSGSRLRGYFYPPTTGNYQFAIAGDDEAILLFSADANPANATPIASASNTLYQQWNSSPSQLSSPIALTAGQACYIEARHKQGAGGSNMSVGYMPPGATSVSLMPTTNVVAFDPGVDYVKGNAAAVVSTAHPRLMGLSPAAVARLKAAAAVPGSVQNANFHTIQTHSAPLLKSTAPIPVEGRDLLPAARRLQKYTYFLGLNYLMTSNVATQEACLNAIYAQLTAAANWGKSGTRGATGWNTNGFLGVSETAHAFAIAYDWCYDGWTPAQRDFIRNTIATNALKRGLECYAAPQMWWVTGSNNWGIVCDGGMVLSALSILGDETAPAVAPAVLDDYIPALYHSPALRGFSPDGGWAEAVCYWDFAVEYLTAALSSLETATGTCYNIDNLEGISSTGSFPINFHGPTGMVYNWGDTYADSACSSPWERYLGIKYNQPLYSWSQQQRSAYIDPRDVIWWDSRLSTVSPTSLNVPTSTYYNDGLIFLRSAWGDPNALYMGMKAGPNFVQHSKAELGSFVFDALGVRWACELGRDSYGLPHYFYDNPWDQPNRWQYYRTRAEGNNTLVINPSLDSGQAYYTGTAAINSFKSNENLQQVVIDMTSAYATTDGNPTHKVSSATPVTQVVRGMRFVNGVAQLQDQVMSSSGVDLNWFMHTKTAVALSSDSTVATLTSGSTHLQMTIQSPEGGKFTAMPAVPLPASPNYTAFQTNPPTDGEAWNTGVTKLRIEVPNSTSTTLTVSMCPYFDGQTPPTPPKVTSFSHW
jgi:hypothetical protein